MVLKYNHIQDILQNMFDFFFWGGGHVALYSKPLHFAIIGAEVSEQLCGMVGMPGTPGTHGPMPDPAPSATVACLCVCVSGLIQSTQAKKRSRLSSSDTFTRRQGPTCACLFHEESDSACRSHSLSRP